MDDEKDYIIVSELSRDENCMTEKQAKIVTVLITVGFVVAIAIMVIQLGRSTPANSDTVDDIIDKVAAVREDYESIMTKADTAFRQRLAQFTFDDVLDIPMLLESYGYKNEDKKWVGRAGVVSFNLFDSIVSFTKTDSNVSYRIVLSQNGTTADDYYCKLGKDILIFNESDIFALGRALVGDESGFIQ